MRRYVRLSRKKRTRVFRTYTDSEVRGDRIHVQLWHTVVVEFDNVEIRLNTGGWKTVTTKNRMNQTAHEYHLGYKVYQQNFEWFVLYKNITYRFTCDVIVLDRT